MRLYSDDGQRVYDVQPATRRRGGSGEVVQAYDQEDQPFAIKQAHLAGPEGPLDDRWLLQEAEWVRTLLATHPDLHDVVVPVVDQGRLNGRHALVMPWMEHRADEYVRHRSLRERVQVAAAVARSVARLQVAPDGRVRDVVHRDIKPSNLFVTPRPDGPEVWLADFGAARIRTPHRTSRGLTLAHTEGYAPLDQVLASRTSQLDPSWDVYATAATVFELITSEPLQSVHSNYLQCTRAGRALRYAQGRDDARQVADLEALRHLAFEDLVHVDRLSAMLSSDLGVLREAIHGAVEETGLAPTARERLEGAALTRLERALTDALQPEPQGRPRDARPLAHALTDVVAWLAGAPPHEARFTPMVWARRGLLLVGLGVGWAVAARMADDGGLDVLPGFGRVAELPYATVEVPRGTATMGARPEEPYTSPDEVPEHRVTHTAPLHVGRTEVTQALWRDLMGDNPVEQATYRTAEGPDQPCHTYGGAISLVGDDLPVVCVTWCEALTFANRLSERDGLPPVYDATQCSADGRVTWNRAAAGWRLPTESEWDYAARAGGAHRFVAGSLHDAAAPSCRQATFFGNVLDETFTATFPYRRSSSPPPSAWRSDCDVDELPPDGVAGLAVVGSFAPNAWKLHDFTGNVREWTYDIYAPYGLKPAVDPVGPSEGSLRTVRGSAFDDDATHWMLANRMGLGHDQRAQIVGLRLVRDVTPRGGGRRHASQSTVSHEATDKDSIRTTPPPP